MAQLGSTAQGAGMVQGLWNAPSTLFSNGLPSETDYANQQRAGQLMQRTMPMGFDPGAMAFLQDSAEPPAPGNSSAALTGQRAQMDFASLLQQPAEQRQFVDAPTTQPGQPNAVYGPVPAASPNRSLEFMFTPMGQEVEKMRRATTPQQFRERMSVLALMGF